MCKVSFKERIEIQSERAAWVLTISRWGCVKAPHEGLCSALSTQCYFNLHSFLAIIVNFFGAVILIIMPEPITIAAATLSIAISAHRLCQDTYFLIAGIRDAPASIQRLSADLKGVDVVLSTLSEGLKADQARGDQRKLSEQLITSVQELLGSCEGVFEDIRKLVSPYVGKDGQAKKGKWRGFMWESFRKGDVAVFQRTLHDYKLTLGLACTTLN
jgi:hypothetical protein